LRENHWLRGKHSLRWAANPFEKHTQFFTLPLKGKNQSKSIRILSTISSNYDTGLSLTETSENCRFAIELLPMKDIYPNVANITDFLFLMNLVPLSSCYVMSKRENRCPLWAAFTVLPTPLWRRRLRQLVKRGIRAINL